MKKYSRKNAFGFLQALLVLFLVTLALTGVILVISRAGANKEIATLRTKIMRVAQTAKLLLSKPESYICDDSSVFVPLGSPPGTAPTKHWTCTVDPNVIDRLQVDMPQANCPGGFCGIQVSAIARPAPVVVTPPDPDNVPKIDLSVRYTGKLLGVSFAANIINENIPNIKVPPEAYAGRMGICGVDKDSDGNIEDDGYLYKGVKANGQDDCRGFPSCNEGKLFVGFNPDGSARCSDLNKGLSKDSTEDKYVLTCPDGRYMSSFNFDPSSSFNPLVSSCKDRIDPCGVGAACPPN